jgi:hypothetical protein
MERKILWEKWVDPFGSNIEDVDLPDHVNLDKQDTRPWRDSYDEAESKQQQQGKVGNNGPVLVGPLGIIPLNEHNIPSKVFNFWMGHTNFKIDEPTAEAIEDVLGVETLDFFSSYRFRFSVAKSFDFQDVRQAIEKAVQSVEPKRKKVKKRQPEKIRTKSIELLKKTMTKKYPYWAIIVLPKGKIKTAGGESQESVQDAIARYKEVEGTEILTSW